MNSQAQCTGRLSFLVAAGFLFAGAILAGGAIWGISPAGGAPAASAPASQLAEGMVPAESAVIEVAAPPGDVSAALLDRKVRQAVALALRPEVIDAAVKDKDASKSAFVSQSPADAAGRLLKAANVQQISGTDLVAVSVKGASAKESAVLANALANAIVGQARLDAHELVRATIMQVDDELNDFSRRLSQTRREAATLLSDATISDLASRRRALDVRMDTMIPEMGHLVLEQASADAALRSLQKESDAGGVDNLPEVVQAVDADPIIRSLRLLEMNLAQDAEEARGRSGPKQEAASRPVARLDVVRRQIDDRRKELTVLQISVMRRTHQERLNAIATQLVKLREEHQAIESVQRDLAARLTKYEQLQADMKPLKEQVDRLIAIKSDMMLKTSSPSLRLRSPASGQ